ncbi:RNA polymerase sigma factor SigJ [Nocardia farcinica]|uniref:sigma factor n=1 Tax=Nocardia farcinica TaxID=37329 RepID=UPI001025D21F|nr:sigma factor [Nocardia farcinica]VFA90552.1 RNA polymerase sigma factor SigJ [Nocardia farcinica]
MVQETYARWYALSERQRREVTAPGAWMTTVAGRICLDLLGSARARRERYVGEWIPEPVPGRPEWLGGSGPGDPRTGSPSTSRSAWPSSWCWMR